MKREVKMFQYQCDRCGKTRLVSGVEIDISPPTGWKDVEVPTDDSYRLPQTTLLCVQCLTSPHREK